MPLSKPNPDDYRDPASGLVTPAYFLASLDHGQRGARRAFLRGVLYGAVASVVYLAALWLLAR